MNSTVTMTTTGKDKKEKKKKGFLDWLVKTFRSGHHIAKNPPKGKRPRKKLTDAKPMMEQRYQEHGE